MTTIWAVAAIFTLGGASAGEWVVDGTSLSAHRGSHPMSRAVDCPPSAGRHALGVAVVAYSKKQGTMTWGHGSIRAVFCDEGELRDVEYEVYRLSAWNESMLRDEYPAEPWASGEWLSTQRGAAVLFRNVGAIDRGWYASAQKVNREIYEVWLDLSQEEQDAVVEQAEQWWSAQLARLRAETTLTRNYSVFRYNCTAVYEELLPSRLTHETPLTPFAWVRRLEGEALALVLHPSHHLVNRWEGRLPERAGRIRPVFRRRKEIRREFLPALRASLAGATPVLPLPLEPTAPHANPEGPNTTGEGHDGGRAEDRSGTSEPAQDAQG